MNGKDLLNKINFIDDDLIEEAANAKKNKKSYKRFYATAVVVCVIISGILLRNYNINKDLINKEDIIVNDEEEKDSLVYIPKIKLSTEPNASYDMIGLIIYKGKIYTQAERGVGEDTIKENNLLGKRLGYAKGNIDELSKQDEYAKEFAGTALGDVYTVNGYSEDFRIAIKGTYKDSYEKDVEYVEFYENLNGIGLSTGKDLFGNKLKIDGNWDYIKYVTHENWNKGYQDYNYLDLPNISDNDIDKFIKELYSGEFVDLTKTNIYDNSSRHLFIYMKDNTRIQLRLFEGGYVGYQDLGWYFVKMPGEIFDKFYESSK
ncbi:hypothetical protein [uncultured Clostridium sp.]|uniref:hypothetical protein n=1 Tax=uncultured Clostridium sp. TaxID=59620 RepID=UPI0025D6A306|nr:hypothetical protein [uncultured Clostridium sp.]